jgi:TRAP-type uncharacterized transport system fused permease subunit
MIRVGYKRELRAPWAASSTGGRITPPVLGAAAFLMSFLAVPYQTIIAAAIVPAFMHFFGVFMQVHFQANASAAVSPRRDAQAQESFKGAGRH